MTASVTFKLGLRSERLSDPVAKGDASRVLAMIESGVYYGYPKCCIEEFVAHYLGMCGFMGYEPRPERKFTGTGYVPCACCDKKEEDQLRSIIYTYRLAPMSFPGDTSTTLFHSYRETLCNRGVLLRLFIDSDPRRHAQVEYLISCLSHGHPSTIVSNKERNEPRQRIVPQPPAQAPASANHERS